jgi:GH15 family glucan-1,4-alpha-glucosidase
MGCLSERFRDCRVGESGPLQIMYGIDGRAELPEEVLTHLEGYRGSAPVRIGNGAVNQLQLDIYGALIDSVYLYNKYGTPIYHDSWLDLARIIEGCPSTGTNPTRASGRPGRAASTSRTRG